MLGTTIPVVSSIEAKVVDDHTAVVVVGPGNPHVVRSRHSSCVLDVELVLCVLIENVGVGLMPLTFIKIEIRNGHRSIHHQIGRSVHELHFHVELVLFRDADRVGFHAQHVVLVGDVAHIDRDANARSGLRLGHRLRQMVRGSLRQVVASVLLVIDVQNETSTRVHSHIHGGIGQSRVQIERGAVVGSSVLRSRHIGELAGLPLAIERTRVPVGNRIGVVHQIAPIQIITVALSREERFRLGSHASTHSERGQNLLGGRQNLKATRPSHTRVILHSDLIVAQTQAIGMIHVQSVVVELAAATHHSARNRIHQFVSHVITTRASVGDVDIHKGLVSSALLDINGHSGVEGLAVDRDTGDRVHTRSGLGGSSVDRSVASEFQTSGQSGARRELLVVGIGRNNGLDRDVDNSTDGSRREGEIGKNLVRVLLQEIEQSQLHGGALGRSHSGELELHALDGHRVGEVEALALSTLGPVHTRVGSHRGPVLSVQSGHSERRRLVTRSVGSGHQAELVHLLATILRIRPLELEEGSAQLRAPLARDVSVESVSSSTARGRGSDLSSMGEIGSRRTQIQSGSEVNGSLRGISVHNSNSEHVGSLLQVVGTHQSDEHMRIQAVAIDRGGASRSHLSFHAHTVHFNTVQIHNHTRTAVHVQLVAVVALDGVHLHSRAEQPHRLRHRVAFGQSRPRTAELHSVPSLRHRSVSQIGPLVHLSVHQELVRERDAIAVSHSRIHSNEEARRSVRVGVQRDGRSVHPFLKSILRVEDHLIASFRQTEMVCLGGRRRITLRVHSINIVQDH